MHCSNANQTFEATSSDVPLSAVRRTPYCPYCGKHFKFKLDLNRHVTVHTGGKLYSCRHCSERFKTTYKRKKHLLESHSEGTWHVCHICEKKFCLHYYLKLHLLKHEAVKPHVCSECPNRFYIAHSLNSDVKRFGCGLCDKNFKYKKRCCETLQDMFYYNGI